jgi:hypothetical protein
MRRKRNILRMMRKEFLSKLMQWLLMHFNKGTLKSFLKQKRLMMF